MEPNIAHLYQGSMYLLVKISLVLSKERARLDLSRNFRASLNSNHISGRNKIGDEIRMQYIFAYMN